MSNILDTHEPKERLSAPQKINFPINERRITHQQGKVIGHETRTASDKDLSHSQKRKRKGLSFTERKRSERTSKASFAHQCIDFRTLPGKYQKVSHQREKQGHARALA